MKRSLTLLVAVGMLSLLVACSSPPTAPPTAAMTAAAGIPKPPSPSLIDEVFRTFELGARAGKGGWPKAVPPALFNNSALDAAYATFAALRNGDRNDQIVARVACFGMSQGLASSSSPVEKDWENWMYSFFPLEFQRGTFFTPPGEYNVLLKAQITRVAKALTVAQQSPGGVTRYYFQYCW